MLNLRMSDLTDFSRHRSIVILVYPGIRASETGLQAAGWRSEPVLAVGVVLFFALLSEAVSWS